MKYGLDYESEYPSSRWKTTWLICTIAWLVAGFSLFFWFALKTHDWQLLTLRNHMIFRTGMILAGVVYILSPASIYFKKMKNKGIQLDT